MKFSVVIPNWNGEELLKKNLPVVLKAAGKKAEVIIVDNGSTDGSVETVKEFARKNSYPFVCGAGRLTEKEMGRAPFIRKNSDKPTIRLIENRTNLGFARAVNQGVERAKGEFAVLLNNDVIPERGFLQPLDKDFSDSKVFAVSLNEPQWSWAKGSWRKGFVEHQPGKRTGSQHLSFWASGGSAAFRKSVWKKLGGFDQIYHPFYWEDTDLSYRAWKRGYRIVWEPRSVVHHKHEGTVSRFSKKYVVTISQRNQLLFIWKNITDPKMMREHGFWLTKRLLTSPGYWRPFLAALIKLPKILPNRLEEIREQRVSDKAVFELFT